jgi:uncharacterized delta-60 repeat protein
MRASATGIVGYQDVTPERAVYPSLEPGQEVPVQGYLVVTGKPSEGNRMHTRIALGAVGAALVAAIAMAGPAQAQASGSLDTSFGSDGLVTLPSGVGGIAQILVQPDGLINVISSETDPTTGNDDMAVVQYEANGTLNTSFGNDGVALASFPGFTAIGLNGVVESSGNIVVAGQGSPVATVTASGTTGGGPGEEAVAEFTSNGTLDSSFGTGGEVITQNPSPIGEGDDQGGNVIVQPNGDIVTGSGVQGTSCNERKGDCTEDDVLTRYLPNGSLDTTFGNGGFSEVDESSFATQALGEDSSGNIYALEANSLSGPTPLEFSPSGAEESATTSTPPSLVAADNFLANGTYVQGENVSAGANALDQKAVMHELPSGQVDPNFNSPAFDYANDSGSAQDTITASMIAPNGDVIVGGIHCTSFSSKGCKTGEGEIGLAALTPTGSLDTTFGADDGVTLLPEESGAVASLAVASNGDYLVAFGTTIAAINS